MGWEVVDMSWFASHKYPEFTVDTIDLGLNATHGALLAYVEEFFPGTGYKMGVELEKIGGGGRNDREEFFAEHIVRGKKVNVVIFPHVEAGKYLLAPPGWLALRIGHTHFPINIIAEEIAQADWREFG